MRGLIKKVDNLINGFTLIELLVAAAIIGVISIVSVNLLYTTVLTRARQDSIKASSEDVRSIFGNLSESIIQSDTVKLVGSTEISTKKEVEGADPDICRTFKLNGTTVELAEDISDGCSYPTSGFLVVTDPNTTVNVFDITETDNLFEITISGTHQDSFGEHDFNFNTSVIPRVSS